MHHGERWSVVGCSDSDLRHRAVSHLLSCAERVVMKADLASV